MPNFDQRFGFTAATVFAVVLIGCQSPPPVIAADPANGLPQYAQAQPVAASASTPRVAPYPPPPKRAEIPPMAPSARSLWQCGHWNWNGAQYVWASGGYIERPEPTANWIPGYWGQKDNGWVWVEGYWTS